MPQKTTVIGVCMGSQSDWAVMKHTTTILDEFGVGYEVKITSAHRTPKRMADYATTAKDRGLSVLIAGAGGAAHLPGMLAAHTTLPVLGVPIKSEALDGVDSLLSIMQMPAGVPVGTLALGKAGAVNAALLAVSILGLSDEGLATRLAEWRRRQSDSVAEAPSDE